jgi:hypothetical protein
MDFARYTHANKFEEVIGQALVDNSYGRAARAHDFFGTNHTYSRSWSEDGMMTFTGILKLICNSLEAFYFI